MTGALSRDYSFCRVALLLSIVVAPGKLLAQQLPAEFLQRWCIDCHSDNSPTAGISFQSLPADLTDPDLQRRWIRIHDRIASGEMPPADADAAPNLDERQQALQPLRSLLLAVSATQQAKQLQLRRLTRREYENTVRDLFDMPGISVAENLPADSGAGGFDTNAEMLDISHVHLARYLETADQILDDAVATRPVPPQVRKRRISLVNRGGFVAHIVMNGDGVLLKDGKVDPEFPAAAEQNHLDQGAHERWGSFRNGASVGLFRHEDESVSPYFIEHVTIYPGKYRVRTSLWSFQWNQGTVLPGRGTEAARLSVVRLTGDGRGGQHPSSVLGYFDAPAAGPLEHEIHVWLNHNELIGFNAASLAPTANYFRKRRAMEFTGPGIVVDWLDIEGPFYDSWPPLSHQQILGNHPLQEVSQASPTEVRYPLRRRPRQLGAGMNRLDPEPGLWTVVPDQPLVAAEQQLASLLPQLFRRPLRDQQLAAWLQIVEDRLDHGDCYELAMRAAIRAALISPDFLFHVTPDDSPPLYTTASRLSYLLWRSQPDQQLRAAAADGSLATAEVLHSEAERLLADPRSKRFIDDFTGQWLKLDQIAATDPDRRLYPEFSPYLQDCMLAESRAWFHDLLARDRDVRFLIHSDDLLINQKLATHYKVPGITGTGLQRVARPHDCPRGGFMTQAAILKVTANGTTTSPVTRGAFLLDRLLGQPAENPPASVPAIEPDVQGAITIRDQLKLHQADPVCASCHRRIDPPGFALEAFDVIGGFRTRYRSIGEGDPAERGLIDPLIGISFKMGQEVDASGTTSSGRTFDDVLEWKQLLAADSHRLLAALTEQLAEFAVGRTMTFADRDEMEEIAAAAQRRGGGLRSLLHELIASPLFTALPDRLPEPHQHNRLPLETAAERPQQLMIGETVPPVRNPITPAPLPETRISTEDVSFNPQHTITVRVQGLFVPERSAAFTELLASIPAIQLRQLDYPNSTAEILWAADSQLFSNADPDQVIERLNQQVRSNSQGLFSVRAIGSLPPEQLQQVQFRIQGLDCLACSLAVHDILVREDGVEYAQASFRDGIATAWIDPAVTSRGQLEETLKKGQVTIAEQKKVDAAENQ